MCNSEGEAIRSEATHLELVEGCMKGAEHLGTHWELIVVEAVRHCRFLAGFRGAVGVCMPASCAAIATLCKT